MPYMLHQCLVDCNNHHHKAYALTHRWKLCIQKKYWHQNKLKVPKVKELIMQNGQFQNHIIYECIILLTLKHTRIGSVCAVHSRGLYFAVQLSNWDTPSCRPADQSQRPFWPADQSGRFMKLTRKSPSVCVPPTVWDRYEHESPTRVCSRVDRGHWV